MKFAFQEWSLGESARNPGWDVVESFVRSAMEANKISAIKVFEPAPGGDRYLISSRLVGKELRAVAQECVRHALRHDAFVMILLYEPLDMREAFGEYVQSADGRLEFDEEERLFGAHLEGFRAALEEGRWALVISHDGDPLFFVHVQW